MLKLFFTSYLPNKNVEDVTKDDIEGFIPWKASIEQIRHNKNLTGHGQGRLCQNSGQLKPTTINANLSPIKKFFDYCGRRDLSESIELARVRRWKPPVFEIDLKKITDLFKSKDFKELKEMTRKAWEARKKDGAEINEYYIERDSLLFYLLFDTGIRVGEGATLKKTSFKFDLKVPVMMVDGKTGQRTIMLTTDTAVKVREFIDTNNIQDYLFVSKSGGALSVNTLKTYIWEMFRVGLSEHYHAHTLRHAYATFMLDRGVPIKYVSNNLGHTSMSTTSIYVDTIKGKNEKPLSPSEMLSGDSK